MSIPAFTAEATLRQASGHYRTSRRLTGLPRRTADFISPALGISDETIDVTSCRPGFVQIGEGANMTCVDPTDPFGTRGHEAGPGDVGGEPADSGGSSGDDNILISEGCTTKQIHSRAAKKCWDAQAKDNDHIHYLRCVGDKMGCCQDYTGKDGKTHRDCTNLTP